MRPLLAGLRYLAKALAKMEDDRVEIQDPLEEINLGTLDNPKLLFISNLLPIETKTTIISLLTFYKDCFTCDYSEVPGLDRDLVEYFC